MVSQVSGGRGSSRTRRGCQRALESCKETPTGDLTRACRCWSVEQIAERIGWFGEGKVAVAREAYVAHSRAEAKDALARQAALTRRIIDVSRSPDSHRDSHVLGY